MKIIPNYPKDIKKNPFYSGIIIGNLIASGIYSIILIDFIFGFLLFYVGVVYYYIKEKEFNKWKIKNIDYI